MDDDRNNQDPSRRKEFLDLIHNEIDRNMAATKMSGFTPWVLTTTLIAALSFYFDEIFNSVLVGNLIEAYTYSLFLLTNLIVIYYSLKITYEGLKSTTGAITIVSRIQLVQMKSYLRLLTKSSFVVVVINILFLLFTSSSFSAIWLVITSTIWYIFRGLLYSKGLNDRLKEVKAISEDCHDYTFLVQPKSKQRILGVKILLLFEMVNFLALAVFLVSNRDSLRFLNLDELLSVAPGIFVFFIILSIIYLIWRNKVDKIVLNQLREFEFELLKSEYGVDEMLELIKDTYKGYSVTEWLESRYTGIWRKLKNYFEKTNRILKDAEELSEDESEDKEKRGVLFATLLLHKQFEEPQLSTYLKETDFHLTRLVDSEDLPLLDLTLVNLIYESSEVLDKLAIEKVESTKKLFEKLQQYYPQRKDNANHPLDN